MNFQIRNEGRRGPLGWVNRMLWLLLYAVTIAPLTVVALTPVPAAAGPAQQATAPRPRLKLVQQAGAVDSTAIKSVTVSCDDDQRTIGGGVMIEGGAPNAIAILGVEPSADLKRITVSASEVNDGTTQSWRLRGYAYCSSLPGTSTLQLVTVSTARDSAPAKRAVATCPAGKDLIGGWGALSTSAYGKLALTGFRPDPAIKEVYATGRELAAGTTASWSMRAHALCADAGRFPNVQEVTGISPVGSSGATSVFVHCPAGRTMIGVAGSLWNTRGEYARDVVLSTMMLYSGGLLNVAYEAGGGTTDDWYLRAYVLCIPS